ncbi:hypothetical protein PR048_014046 [Dryococelus australis]|uniref:Uncharacterized protein n=1 Tax=Dryococelus australis TaxID=614101 RepID=A0ABQ9HVI9_9NEOP|nr:hypothetical protein PR048_014046 [Dryococelus australis]
MVPYHSRLTSKYTILLTAVLYYSGVSSKSRNLLTAVPYYSRVTSCLQKSRNRRPWNGFLRSVVRGQLSSGRSATAPNFSPPRALNSRGVGLLRISCLTNSSLLVSSSRLPSWLRYCTRVQAIPVSLCRRYCFVIGDMAIAAMAKTVELLASHQGEPGSIPGRDSRGLSHIGIVPDDAAGRRVFLGISPLSSTFIPALFHSNLISPSLALNKLSLPRGKLSATINTARQFRALRLATLAYLIHVAVSPLTLRASRPFTRKIAPRRRQPKTVLAETSRVAVGWCAVDLGFRRFCVRIPVWYACLLFALRTIGAEVVKWLVYSPPPPNRRTGFDTRQGHSRIFACGNRTGRCRWSVGFLGDLPIPPSLHSSFIPHFTLIGSQDREVKSCPDLHHMDYKKRFRFSWLAKRCVLEGTDTWQVSTSTSYQCDLHSSASSLKLYCSLVELKCSLAVIACSIVDSHVVFEFCTTHRYFNLRRRHGWRSGLYTNFPPRRTGFVSRRCRPRVIARDREI